MSIASFTAVVDPVDTLMFRDGRPFNQADPGASRAVSVFPPFPPTMVGTIRFALFQTLGAWNADLLGDGTNWQDPTTLGPLIFGAPIVLYHGNPVFPVPLHILEGKDATGHAALTRLSPGRELSSDLGRARLPKPERALMGVKPIEERWVTAEGLRAVLDGGLPGPSNFVDVERDLWVMEPRVGIGIDRTSRTTSDGRLYMASHIRVRPDVSLCSVVQGYTGARPNGEIVQTMGGENKMIGLEFLAGTHSLPRTSSPSVTYCIVLISPLVLPSGMELKPDAEIPGYPGKLVSACLGKPVRIGGWNSQAHRKGARPGGEALPMHQALPAGSVFFMKADSPPDPATCGFANAPGRNWGFGQAVIGGWEEGLKA